MRSPSGKPVLSLALALLVLVIPGCGRQTRLLRVGANIWPGYEMMFLAQDLGYYKDAPIELVTFPSTTEVIRAYRNKAINIAALTLDEALVAARSMPGQSIVLVCDVSNGADVVIARPEFRDMRDLRGRRVGLEQNALGAFMLSRALESAGMTPLDIQVVPVPLDEHESAYRTGAVDAIVTFEPNRSRLLAAGGRQVFDSSKVPGEIVDVLLTSSELAAGADKSLGTLIDGWFRALHYFRQEPADAARRMAVRAQVGADEFTQSLAGLDLPDRASNQRLLGNAPGNLKETIDRLRALMVSNRLLADDGDATLVLDDRFVGKVPK